MTKINVDRSNVGNVDLGSTARLHNPHCPQLSEIDHLSTKIGPFETKILFFSVFKEK